MPILLNTIFDYVFGDRAKARSVPEGVKLSSEQQAKKKEREAQAREEKKFEFFVITNDTTLSAEFRMMLRGQNSSDLECLLYGNNTDVLEKTSRSMRYEIPNDDEIKKQFEVLEQQYGYSTVDKDALDLFIKLFKANKLIADYVEENNTDDNAIAYQHAYKMMVLFELESKQPFTGVDKFLNKHVNNSAKPIGQVLNLL
jgi:hypothetical protein